MSFVVRSSCLRIHGPASRSLLQCQATRCSVFRREQSRVYSFLPTESSLPVRSGYKFLDSIFQPGCQYSSLSCLQKAPPTLNYSSVLLQLLQFRPRKSIPHPRAHQTSMAPRQMTVEGPVGSTPTDLTNVGEPWSTGLYDCHLNPTNTIMTAFFPCVTFGEIAEILDHGKTSSTLGSFMYILMVPAMLTCCNIGAKYRKKLRNRYNLVEAPGGDLTLHLFCFYCALCQEFRELQHRGIDPSLGWMGNLAQQQGAATAAPGNQFMGR
ncbi:Protein PLANT CADMIUM RESISTANCE 8 [Platanthera zijinensis]|uniref:Protein PLANT CADMIUM RESISTANCE 8 n=1 Tax=Platanthera zijinensis TaxID=2320716 RepID=A0AAP0BH73_9ASPA